MTEPPAMRLFAGYAKPVAALAASPDGSRLYSAGVKHLRVWVWDVAAGEVVAKRLSRFNFGEGVGSLAVSPSGDYILSASQDGGVTLWAADGSGGRGIVHGDNPGGEPRVVHHPRLSLAAAPCRFFVRDREGWHTGFEVFDPASPDSPAKRFASDDFVSSLALSPDGRRIATATAGGVVTLTDIETAAKLGEVARPRGTTRLAFHPTNDVFAISSGRSVFVADGTNAAVTGEHKGHEAVIRSVAYSPDGRYLASISDDGCVLLRDGKTHDLRGRRHLDIGKLGALCWRPDSSGLYAGGEKLIADCDLADIIGVAKARPKSTEPLSLAGHGKTVTRLAYSPDGRRLLTCETSHTVRGWDVSGGAGQARPTFVLERHGSECVQAASWSNDGRVFVLSCEHGGALHDGETGTLMRGVLDDLAYKFQAHHLPTGELFVRHNLRESAHLHVRNIQGVAVASATIDPWSGYEGHYLPTFAASPPSGSPVYFGMSQTMTFRWDRATGETTELIRQTTIRSAMALSPDGRHIVTAGATCVYVWDAATGAHRHTVKHPLTVTGVAFTPDGRLVTSCYDGVVRFFDGASGDELFAFDLGMGRVYSLAVAPDGMTFAAGVHKRNAVVLMDVPE